MYPRNRIISRYVDAKVMSVRLNTYSSHKRFRCQCVRLSETLLRLVDAVCCSSKTGLMQIRNLGRLKCERLGEPRVMLTCGVITFVGGGALWPRRGRCEAIGVSLVAYWIIWPKSESCLCVTYPGKHKTKTFKHAKVWGILVRLPEMPRPSAIPLASVTSNTLVRSSSGVVTGGATGDLTATANACGTYPEEWTIG